MNSEFSPLSLLLSLRETYRLIPVGFEEFEPFTHLYTNGSLNTPTPRPLPLQFRYWKRAPSEEAADWTPSPVPASPHPLMPSEPLTID